ncbi:hypothetical protein, partial [Xylella fastidiosa]|uniref:hypothetical protein n=1 Tax=Xylella fastidiosa TaxID=2371 RepID=UPI002360B515
QAHRHQRCIGFNLAKKLTLYPNDYLHATVPVLHKEVTTHHLAPPIAITRDNTDISALIPALIPSIKIDSANSNTKYTFIIS